MNNIEILEQSVKSLFLKFQFNGHEIATGTGLVLKTPNDKFVLITNRHNVTGRNNVTGNPLDGKTAAIPNEIVIIHNNKNKLGNWIEQKEVLYVNDKPIWFEHPIFKEKVDFVAIPITQLNDVALYPYDTVSNPQLIIKPTDKISVVGFPFGMAAGGKFGIWVTGFVASEPMIDYDNLPLFLIDCRSRKGQSGSPVIAHRNSGIPYHTTQGVQMMTNGSITNLLGEWMAGYATKLIVVYNFLGYEVTSG